MLKNLRLQITKSIYVFNITNLKKESFYMHKIYLCSSFQPLHRITQNFDISQGKNQSFYTVCKFHWISYYMKAVCTTHTLFYVLYRWPDVGQLTETCCQGENKNTNI